MVKAELKTKKNDDNPTNFLNSITDPKRRSDATEVCKLMTKITQQEPAMWGSSIVGFGNYEYKYASGREGSWFRVGLSPRKQNLTIYIMSGFGEYKPLLDRLGKYTTGKSCLYIKKLEDINLEVLSDLIKKSYVSKAMGEG